MESFTILWNQNVVILMIKKDYVTINEHRSNQLHPLAFLCVVLKLIICYWLCDQTSLISLAFIWTSRSTLETLARCDLESESLNASRERHNDNRYEAYEEQFCNKTVNIFVFIFGDFFVCLSLIFCSISDTGEFSTKICMFCIRNYIRIT